ncbi:hypothetical protein C8R47DRAFT_164654 [Mycena vitilis]|nr:hypothetical protein C8R47DRAFT_164654 [Mycena vitilis]
MAPASPVPSSVSDSEKKTKKRSSPSKKKDESEVEDSEPAQSAAEDDDGDEDGDEEVYEIEEILDAKRGHFPKNKLGFLVSWKGYGPEHNSWVAEEDATAPELIAAYWKRNPDKNPNKKKMSETPSKRLATGASARKAVTDDASDAGGSASVVKKRGRKSVSEKATAKDDDERPAKKPRKVNSAAARASASEEPMQVDEEQIGNMSEHMQVPTWDQLIKQIDTVERVDDTLYVYFTLQTGERMREDSKICADKFPKMLISFYESNLRWKEADRH